MNHLCGHDHLKELIYKLQIMGEVGGGDGWGRWVGEVGEKGG